MLRRDRPQCSAQRSIRPRYFSRTRMQVGALDPLGQLVGDLLERAVEVEVEAERLLAGRDDLGRAGSRARSPGPGVVTTICSMTCSSSRTLPGQS